MSEPFHWVGGSRGAGGSLHAESVAIARLAKEVGTPFYCYSAQALEEAYAAATSALARALPKQERLICYSLKANSNLALVALLAQAGAGADIVSGGELARARKAGIAGKHIVFSGVGKTDAELDAALAAGILQFNVESRAELTRISARARALNKRARIALRLNPDIDARTHEKITTGTADNKFGMPQRAIMLAAEDAHKDPALDLVGLDLHIGSQIHTMAAFARGFRAVRKLARELEAAGHPLQRIDLGGGLGIAYAAPRRAPDWKAYAQCVARVFGNTPYQLIFEPGRALVARAGILVARVLEHKTTARKKFLILDAAMSELIRPTLYGAEHHIAAVARTRTPAQRWDIVGPICESGDFLARGRKLAAPPAGGLLAIFDVGAYGAALGSTYNSRPLAPEILVRGRAFFLIRRKPALKDLWHNEAIPNFLA